MAKRQLQGINTASMADISFLLLSFFLLTSSFDTEQGIPRRLPPQSDETPKETLVNQRNVFVVKINFKDEIMAGDEVISINQLTDLTKEFLENPLNATNLPEKELRFIEKIGEYPVSKGIISLQNDQNTSYNMYVQVQNELQRAVNELRDKISIHYFGKLYDRLDTTLQKAIQKAVPVCISEAQPSTFGKVE
jgi:biopolymer transport protein ExbD